MTTFNNIEALEKFVNGQEIVRNTNEIARIEHERERVKLYNKLKELDEILSYVTQIRNDVDALVNGGLTAKNATNAINAENATNADNAINATNATNAERLTSVLPIANGGTGSTTVSGAIAALGITDYIVEQDTSGEWFYRKWSSGLAEMFCSKTHSLDFSTEYNGYLYVSPVIHESFPFTLVEEPIFYISSASTVSETGSHSGYTEATTSSIDTYAVAKTTGIEDVYVKLYVVGKWK